MRKKRAFIFILLALLLLVFSAGSFAAPNAYVEKGRGSAGLNFTYLMKLKSDGGTSDNVPAYGLSLRYAPFNRLAIGFNIAKHGFVDDFLRTNVHLQYMFEKPFFSDTWTSVKAGYSERRYLTSDLSMLGGCAGILLSRNFKDSWWAHTSIEIEIYKLLIAPAYSVGFEYFLKPKVSLGISLDGTFDVDGHQHGPSLTAKFHF